MALSNLLIFITLGLVQSQWAKDKGYDPIAWFFTAGPLGAIILAFQKNLKKSDLSEDEIKHLKQKGDRIGWIFSGIALVLVLILLLINIGNNF